MWLRNNLRSLKTFVHSELAAISAKKQPREKDDMLNEHFSTLSVK